MSYGDSLAVADRIEGKIPVIGSGGVSGWHNRCNFDGPGIVIGRKGSYGSIHWVETDGFAIDTAYFINKSTTSVDLRWLFFVLQAIDLKGPSQDVGVPGLSREAAYAQLVPSPPSVEEQRRIADFLDAETSRIDRMLDASQRLLTLSAERRSVHRSFLMRGAEVRGARRVHPILGPLPFEWKVLPLKRLVPRIGVGVVVDPSSYFSEQGVPFLRGSNILEGAISTEGVKLMTEADSRQLWRSRLAEGDVVVVRAGYPGRAAVVPSTLEGANCASLVVIKKGELLIPGFLEAYFNSSLGQAYVNLVRYGAAQEQINVSHVVDFDVPVPPINAQKEILAELERADRSVLALMRKAHDSRALLAERRRAVITAAVTGQFDVTTASGRNLTQGV